MPAQAPFRLVVITPEGLFEREQWWANRLFEKGLQVLHLRKPGWPEEALLAYLDKIEPQYYSRIVVHHQPGLLQQLPLLGVHLQAQALPAVKPIRYKLSCPVHSWQGFVQVQGRVDWALISPFFNSLSKEGYGANAQLWQIPAEVIRQKAVALGGITAKNVLEVKQLGLGGAAVLGAIWQAADPLKAFLRIEQELKNG